MKNTLTCITLFLLSTLPITAAAQAEEKEESKSYIYATYYFCDAGNVDRADEIMNQVEAPIFNQAVKDGQIDSWGWLAHHTGGLWRRAQYYIAPSLNDLLDAQTAMNEGRDDEAQAMGDEFSSICGSHQDYIWERVVGSTGDGGGTAAFSVYMICDETREERADEIFSNDFAPIFDKAVKDGKIDGWGWNSHWVGGKFRRLQTLSGSDHKTLLAARGELIEAMYGDDNEAGAEFSSICNSHEDYMWNIETDGS